MDKRQQIEALARKHGVVRPRDLASFGVNSHDLQRLVAEGVLTRSGRGIYSLAEFDVTESHSLVEAVQTQSKGVICLLSALRFHELGTQLPHQVWMSVPYGARISARTSVPVRVVIMRPPAYDAGIEMHDLEGIEVPIYSIAKTIADCFKFRNKIGIDVAIEALRDALQDRRCSREDIRKFARIDRVERVMNPYLEALSS